MADFDPLITAIWAQPCRLMATVDGKQRHHVPDFLFASPTGEVTVVNVKPAHRLADARVAEALAWPRALLTGHGWRYEVWSGCDPVLRALDAEDAIKAVSSSARSATCKPSGSRKSSNASPPRTPHSSSASASSPPATAPLDERLQAARSNLRVTDRRVAQLEAQVLEQATTAT